VLSKPSMQSSGGVSASPTRRSVIVITSNYLCTDTKNADPSESAASCRIEFLDGAKVVIKSEPPKLFGEKLRERWIFNIWTQKSPAVGVTVGLMLRGMVIAARC